MTVFYRDPTVQVTSDAVEVNGRRYPFTELTRVWHQRGSRSWREIAGRGAVGLALLVPLVFAAIGLVIAARVHISAGGRVALILGACLVGLLAAPLADVLLERVDRSYARGARTREIWATWRGSRVLLVRTEDALRFGQIYRALQRASEQAPSTRR